MAFWPEKSPVNIFILAILFFNNSSSPISSQSSQNFDSWSIPPKFPE